MRKHTLEYDDVMNKQREEIYAFRNEVLQAENPIPLAEEILENVCMEMSGDFFVSRSIEGGWNPEGYRNWLVTHFPITFEAKDFDDDFLVVEEIEKLAAEKVVEAFRHKIAHQKKAIQDMDKLMNPGRKTPLDPQEVINEVVLNMLIHNIDHKWQEHLLHIDHLRTEVSVRTIGQKDPLQEFKHEAFALFDHLSREIKVEIAHSLFRFEMVQPEEPEVQTIDLPRQKKKKEVENKPKEEKRSLSPMIDLSMLDFE